MRIPETPIHRIQMESLYCMQDNIDEDGMAMHCLDLRPNFLEACSGVVFKHLDAIFKVELKDPESKSQVQSYTLIVILWTTKKLILKEDSKDPLFYNISVDPIM